MMLLEPAVRVNFVDYLLKYKP